MKTYPVYFYEKEIGRWNPLIETIMEVIRASLIEKNMSTSDYGNLIVSLYEDKVVVVTRMAGEGG